MPRKLLEEETAALDVSAALTRMESAMQYALVNGEKREASRGLIGFCQGCDAPMIPKCGPIKAPHWAHKSEARCDPWWEKETKWHRDWKELFPADWREVRQHDANGECHIADIRTEHGLVIECQHSSIGAPEIAARETFYQSVGTMVWVVDGAGYKTGTSKLSISSKSWMTTPLPWLFTSSRPSDSFPKTWLNCSVPVFFDFASENTAGEQIERMATIFCLLPGRAAGLAVIARISREYFVSRLRGGPEVFPYAAIMAELANGLTLMRHSKARQAQPIPPWRQIADYRNRNRRRF